MKKKLVCLLLIGTLTLSLTACGGKTPDAPSEPTQSVEESTPTQSEEVENSSEEQTEENQDAGNTNEEAKTIAPDLKEIFVNTVKENPDATPEEIAAKFKECPQVQFMGDTMPVEEGWLNGFNKLDDEFEVKGFTKGAMFAPMIGSIAFISYVFELPEDADAEAFEKMLLDNSNPRWNICVEAAETLTAVEGNKVFFVMAPALQEE